MTDARPYSKETQLARSQGRRFRVRATRAEWEWITALKLGPCRVCVLPASNGHGFPRVHMHHLVSRAQGGGDVPSNIVPLCLACHDDVHGRAPDALRILAESLTEAEREYVIGKRGELRL